MLRYEVQLKVGKAVYLPGQGHLIPSRWQGSGQGVWQPWMVSTMLLMTEGNRSGPIVLNVSRERDTSNLGSEMHVVAGSNSTSGSRLVNFDWAEVGSGYLTIFTHPKNPAYIYHTRYENIPSANNLRAKTSRSIYHIFHPIRQLDRPRNVSRRGAPR